MARPAKRGRLRPVSAWACTTRRPRTVCGIDVGERRGVWIRAKILRNAHGRTAAKCSRSLRWLHAQHHGIGSVPATFGLISSSTMLPSTESRLVAIE